LRGYIKQYIDDSKKNNMRISVIGDIERLDGDIRENIGYLMDLTKNHAGMRVNIAINYGGRDDILRAARKMSADVAAGSVRAEDVNEAKFAAYLDTYDLPDPDLFIRTGGDFRISNFLIWQMAYTEFYNCDKLWPDFTFDDLEAAVKSFAGRERRFGGRN
jgi:undecaprenyl diphosphate synthase